MGPHSRTPVASLFDWSDRVPSSPQQFGKKNSMKLLPCATAVFLAAAASAQTGTYTWQASANGGLTWNSVAVALPGTLIKVRLLASWSGISGSSIGYAGGQFDATLANATTLDSISN